MVIPLSSRDWETPSHSVIRRGRLRFRSGWLSSTGQLSDWGHTMKSLLTGAALAALALATPLAANDLEDTAARFGFRETILQIALSPSGQKVVFVGAGPEHSEVVKVADVDGNSPVTTIISNSEREGDITQCEWATETRIVCQLQGMGKRSDGVLLPYTRTFAIDDDGSDVKMLSERQSYRALGFRQDGGDIVALDVDGKEGQILFTHEYVKEMSTGTRLANSKEGLGVDAVDVENGRARVIMQPDAMATRYVADENGSLRLKRRDLVNGQGYLTGERVFLYRPAKGGSWERFDSVTIDGKVREEFTPTAVDAGRNVVYGFDRIGGYDAVVEVPLDGSNAGKVVMVRDDVDVDSLIRIGRQRRVVGATYATEKRAIKYFDPELNGLSTALSAALPDDPLINIIGASADEKRLLIIASSDTDPGTVYLYDKPTQQLRPLLDVREYLAQRPMGTMKPIAFNAADGTKIPGYLTLPAGSDGKDLPAVVLPHGGPAARDEWGFDWLVQFFTARGYAVLQPNYRGSAGYGEQWYGRNGYQSWETAIGDVNDAGRWLVAEGIADPARMAIAGWSYGGYAALQSQVLDPELYKAVVAIAPVTDLEYLRDDSRQYTGYELRDEQLGRGPHIEAGSPRRHADGFSAPVALFHGDMDLNVDVRHSRDMADRLESAGKDVTYTEYEGLQHDLGDSRVRAEMLMAIDRFLADALDN